MEMPRRDKPRHAVCEDGRAGDYLLAALKAAFFDGALSVPAAVVWRSTANRNRCVRSRPYC